MYTVFIGGAAVGTHSSIAASRNSLGDRRWRIWAWSTQYEPALGGKLGTDASLKVCLSSSNNGVGQGRKLPAVNWTGGHGTRCQIQGRKDQIEYWLEAYVSSDVRVKMQMKIHDRVSVSELRKNLGRYLRDAMHGRTIVVTLRGQSVAILIAAASHPDVQIANELP